MSVRRIKRRDRNGAECWMVDVFVEHPDGRRVRVRKACLCNSTNQWSIAVLTGSKSAVDWIGKTITLCVDTDIESGQPTRCVRVAGSPDASPHASKAYAEAWGAGDRKRGKLCKRLKRVFRMLAVGETETVADEQAPQLEAQDEPGANG